MDLFIEVSRFLTRSASSPINWLTFVVFSAMASMRSWVDALELGDNGASSDSISKASCRLRLDRRERFGAVESRLRSKSSV